jgi:arabinose-5-phosphate isomerase
MAAPDHHHAERRFMEQVLHAEAAAIMALIDRLGDSAGGAVDLICRCADAGGSVLVAGLGKSGLIGKKISATLASLGVPSHDIHPAEAVHGDLGRIRTTDLLLALSNSGETEEVVTLAALMRQDGVPIISITGGDGNNALGRLATVSLTLGPITEGGDLGLAPTCSTTATLALGDALALAAARRRAFTADDFAKRHPGGLLGGLLRPVTECLRFTAGRNLPLVHGGMTVRRALDEAQAMGRRPGAVIVVGETGVLAGIFTDGDLRRLVLRDVAGLDRPIAEVMTRHPRCLKDSALVRDAVRMFREHRQDEIPVVDEAGKPVGMLDVQDLIAMKVVQA